MLTTLPGARPDGEAERAAHLQMAEQVVAEATARQHPLHSLLNNPLRDPL